MVSSGERTVGAEATGNVVGELGLIVNGRLAFG